MRVVKRTRLAAVAALALGVGAFAAAPASAAPVSAVVDGVTYSADDDDATAGAEVVSFDRSTATVDIPDTVDIGGTDYDVVAIAEKVFQDASLTGVTIGRNVATIENMAFQKNDLGSVTIPDSVITIGQNAFGFTKLTDLNLGNSVTTILNGAFSSNRLTSVIIPASVTTIGWHAFANNSDLTSVEFTGAAPSVSAATSVPGSGSFDTKSGSLVLSYPIAYDALRVIGGFTTPTWQGYDTKRIEDGSPAQYLSITKTVDASFVRVYDWDLDKVGTVRDITAGDDEASADIDFTVTVTPTDYTDSYYLLSGEITVTNEILEPMEVDITDVTDIGVDASCTMTGPSGEAVNDLQLSANESVTLDYVCELDGVPEDGTNTATVTWGELASARVVEDVVFTQRETSFETITVVDVYDGGTELGTVTWNGDRQPVAFDYTATVENLPLDECTSMTNTAMIYEMEMSVQEVVEICPESIAPEPDPEPTVDPEPTPDPDPTPVEAEPKPEVLVQTGADLGSGHVVLAIVLLLTGAAALLVTRRHRIHNQR